MYEKIEMRQNKEIKRERSEMQKKTYLFDEDGGRTARGRFLAIARRLHTHDEEEVLARILSFFSFSVFFSQRPIADGDCVGPIE